MAKIARLDFSHSGFEFVSDFVLGISDFPPNA